MLTKIFPFCLLAKCLKGKQELERAKARKARSLGVLARLKSSIPIKGSLAIYSTKTHFKTSEALEPIVNVKCLVEAFHFSPKGECHWLFEPETA